MYGYESSITDASKPKKQMCQKCSAAALSVKFFSCVHNLTIKWHFAIIINCFQFEVRKKKHISFSVTISRFLYWLHVCTLFSGTKVVPAEQSRTVGSNCLALPGTWHMPHLGEASVNMLTYSSNEGNHTQTSYMKAFV